MKSDLQSIMKGLIKTGGNELATIVSEGTAGDIIDFIDTGCYRLNAQMSGSIWKGCPTNRIIGFGGESQTLKSIISRLIIKSFLEQYPDDGMVYVFETEGSAGAEDYEEMGCDTKRIVFSPVATIEQFRNESTRVLNQLNEMKVGDAPRVLFVLDSYGNLVTEKTENDAQEGNNKKDFTKQQLAGQTFGLISNKLLKHKYTLLMPNHVYQDFGGYVPTIKFSGGTKYVYISTILFTQTKANIYSKDKKSVIGAKITFNTFKSRLTVPKKKSALLVSFAKGIWKYSGLIDDAIDSGVWVKYKDKIITDLKFIEQMKIRNDISKIENMLPLKSFYANREYLADICLDMGLFKSFRNEDGENIIVTDPKLIENLKTYKEYLNEPSKLETIQKKLAKNDVLFSDYVNKTYAKYEIAECYKTVYTDEMTTPINDFLTAKLEEIKNKINPDISDEDINNSAVSTSAIQKNGAKYFSKEVLNELDVYLKNLFCYGSKLESQKHMELIEAELVETSTKKTSKKKDKK